MDRSLSAKICH